MTSSKPPTVGVVGCGYWGPNLIRNFHNHAEVELKTIADLDPERLAHVAQLYPTVHQTRDYREIVGDPEIDAVVGSQDHGGRRRQFRRLGFEKGRNPAVRGGRAGAARQGLEECFASQRGRRWFTPETFLSLMRIRGVECDFSRSDPD